MVDTKSKNNIGMNAPLACEKRLHHRETPCGNHPVNVRKYPNAQTAMLELKLNHDL
jgi:hypothetical protein